MESTAKAAAADKIRERLQWWRVPLMTAFILIGVYFIRKETPILWAGMAVTLFGEFFQLWAASHLRKDKKLATSGPYSHVRNPMYFGRFFVLLGFTIMIGRIWLIATFIIIFVLYVRGRVGREENRLRRIFGEDYENYCREVPRFIPRLRPYSNAAHERWQWSKLATNHEYLNLIAALAVFALILVRIRLFPHI